MLPCLEQVATEASGNVDEVAAATRDNSHCGALSGATTSDNGARMLPASSSYGGGKRNSVPVLRITPPTKNFRRADTVPLRRNSLQTVRIALARGGSRCFGIKSKRYGDDKDDDDDCAYGTPEAPKETGSTKSEKPKPIKRCDRLVLIRQMNKVAASLSLLAF